MIATLTPDAVLLFTAGILILVLPRSWWRPRAGRARGEAD